MKAKDKTTNNVALSYALIGVLIVYAIAVITYMKA
jgi:hypothetical protein